MQINPNGSSSITDDDEGYLEDGIFSWQIDSQRLHHLLYLAIKQCPEFYNTELCKEIINIHSLHENVGFCSHVEFRSNSKRVVCHVCGKIVSLT